MFNIANYQLKNSDLIFLLNTVHDAEEFFQRVGPQHRDAGRLEVGDPLEDGAGSQVTPVVQDTPYFIGTLHALLNLLLQDVEIPVE